MSKRLWSAAVVAGGILLAYFAVTTLVDLFPFNNVRGSTLDERVSETIINGIPLLLAEALIVLSILPKVRWFGYVAAALLVIQALLGLSLWWLPYLADVTVPWATVPGTTWAELHARTYADTIIVLPEIGDRPRPNLEHMILHASMIVTAVLAFAQARRRRTR